ncbi:MULTISPECIES: CPBP family intramembrane glutamic endopeptidase [Corallococcus]|uniref:CPBP family intramembrane glutamic endopeptidase n=1 Tax=Corallococcus TaxID=83461 RepID=UPI00117FF252|nr:MULTISPECIES: CPBP family intramembrane glutamic endopeptidase [Corallococcus]NBD09652.1 CPBP family intramembrane metalloprotease [Corallococcus silvisoli]TSC24151.1 CPBP family intramembrane metalloprotease [Corallococcus sp. Z5C101001]
MRGDVAVLLEKAPPRRQALSEAAFVFFAVLGPSTVGRLGLAATVAVGVALLAWGLALLRPWESTRQGAWWGVVGLLVALGGTGAGAWVATDAEVTKGFSLSMAPLVIRALGMCLLVAVLLWRDGQGPAQVGLVREGWARELLLGVPVLAGTYAVHIAVSVPLAAVAVALKLAGKELLARKGVAAALLDTGLGVPAFAAIMVVVTGFEEFVFRGFLVPRLRVVLGGWVPAVLCAAVLFCVGHFYEGTLAVFQTFVMGAWFGVVFWYRGRLLPLMVAHAAFNTISFALMLWLSRSGLLEKLPPL